MSALQKRLCRIAIALVLIAGVSVLTLMSQQRGGGGAARNPAGQGVAGGNGVYTDLPGGYTTLVDMGSGDSWAPIEYRDAVNRGWVPGPRIEVAGPHLNPRVNTRYPAPSVFIDNFGQGPYSPSGRPHWENGSNFYSAADGRRLVREHAWYGVDLIKAYMTEDIEDGGDIAGFGGAFYPDGRMINIQSLTYDEIAAATEEAHRHNLKVVVHVYGGPGVCDRMRA